jgi:hypothetical protein
MSRVVRMRLKEADADRLLRLSRRPRRSVSETAALLVSEKLREEEEFVLTLKPASLLRLRLVETGGDEGIRTPDPLVANPNKCLCARLPYSIPVALG